MEIEAIGNNEQLTKSKLQEQCEYYMQQLEINEKDLIQVSYSDLLLDKSDLNTFN